MPAFCGFGRRLSQRFPRQRVHARALPTHGGGWPAGWAVAYTRGFRPTQGEAKRCRSEGNRTGMQHGGPTMCASFARPGPIRTGRRGRVRLDRGWTDPRSKTPPIRWTTSTRWMRSGVAGLPSDQLANPRTPTTARPIRRDDPSVRPRGRRTTRLPHRPATRAHRRAARSALTAGRVRVCGGRRSSHWR